jgi:hypothetical protein
MKALREQKGESIGLLANPKIKLKNEELGI